MRRIQKGPVRGISLKIQEEERERLYNIAPKNSRVTMEREVVQAEKDVVDMLKTLGFNKLVDSKYVTERQLGEQ